MWSSEELKSLPTFTDYDEAMAYRDRLIDQKKAERNNRTSTQTPETALDPVTATFQQAQEQQNAANEAIAAAQNAWDKRGG